MRIEKEGELTEDVPFRGTYRAPRWILYFEGRIALRDGYYYRGSCRTPRQMHGQICPPMGPGLSYSGCLSLVQTCIIILDIALHILIITELNFVSYLSCDCLFTELVIDEY